MLPEKKHKERAHSKFSASGADRWLKCPGSVAASEGIPSKDSVWSLEGVKAHEVLETVLRAAIEIGGTKVGHARFDSSIPREMQTHALRSANFLLGLHARTPHSKLLVETRIHLPFIHEDMFGTFDGAVIDLFDTLHVYDYKYGAGHAVSPRENLQMIVYGMGLAYRYKWNFKRVRLWIDQPRIKGYDGPAYWEIMTAELLEYVGVFRKGVKRALTRSDVFVEGQHCHWCNAKRVCPKKIEVNNKKALAAFDPV